MDIATLIAQLDAEGTLPSLANRPLGQFGTPERRYIGAELLPEQRVNENAYREENIKYRTIIANSGSRYSPTQKKKGALVGSFLVELGDSDIASELTAREYDSLIRLLNSNASMDAMANVINFIETTVNRPLIELNEKQRWDAIVNAQVQRRGDNGYSEDVQYPNPSGHRVVAAGSWSTDTYDPFDDIYAMADTLQGKGFTVGRIISTRNVASILARNDKVRTRVGQDTGLNGRASLSAINLALGADGLPNIELYDLLYRTNTGTGRFLPNDVFVMVATTGRDASLDLGDEIEVVPDTLGYTAIGRAAGQSGPGRVIRAEHFENKPPRVEAEGWQTSLPVITEPEAVGVISGIT